MAWKQVLTWQSPRECICKHPDAIECQKAKRPDANYPCICNCHEDTKREYYSPIEREWDRPGEDEAWSNL